VYGVFSSRANLLLLRATWAGSVLTRAWQSATWVNTYHLCQPWQFFMVQEEHLRRPCRLPRILRVLRIGDDDAYVGLLVGTRGDHFLDGGVARSTSRPRPA
jgi:hypothetical protein